MREVRKKKPIKILIFLAIIASALALTILIYSKYSWKTFISGRIGLSFKYPPTWSVTPCKDDMIIGWDRVEYITFAKTCPVGDTRDGFGDITVSRVKDEKTLEQLKSESFDYLRQAGLMDSSKVSEVIIGNQKGIEYTTKIRSLDTYVYLIRRNGYEYTIFFYNTEFNSRHENIQTVSKILSTFIFK